MTYKSIFTLGVYEGLTVQNLLDSGKIEYLCWVYFHISNITFIDEILALIGIDEDFKIEKPGIKKDGHKEVYWHKVHSAAATSPQSIISIRERYKKNKIKGIKVKLLRSHWKNTSKGLLQRKNHGK